MTKKLILIILIFTITGCYDHQELNEITILTATEINKINNEYILNIEIINPMSKDKTTVTKSPFTIYQSKGKTIQEAYRMLKLSLPRYIYPDHLRIVIISEKLAKEDISEILDFYLRNPLARTEFKILITKDENILNLITPIEPISSNSILDTLETSSNYLGITNIATLNDLATMYLNPNTEIILPSIELTKEKNNNNTIEDIKKTEITSTYKLGPLAIFKDNKLLDYLTNEESITYNLIKNKIKNSIITYECSKSKYLSLEIIKSKSTITTKNKEINIDIDIEATINESTCKINLNKNESINSLENNVNNYLKENITNNINHIRNTYNSDIFGFLDIIYKYDYQTYEEVKDNWYDFIFKNIKINVTPKVKIIAKGSVMEGINEKN